MAKRKEIWYIHGANCSSLSFSYFEKMLPKHNVNHIEYEPTHTIPELLNFVYSSLPVNTPISIIGHSLGGVIAVLMSQHRNAANYKIEKIVTLASPFGGSKAANILKWIHPEHRFLNDLSQYSDVIMNLQNKGAIVPTLNLISTTGTLPIMREPNDGIVSVASQHALRGARKQELPVNHFEILLSEESIRLTKEFIWEPKRNA